MSAPIFRPLTYAKYAASPEYGGFRALHPNIAVLRESDGAHLVRMTAFSTALSGVPAERTFGGVDRRDTASKPSSKGGHVRFSTLPFSERAFPCLTLKYRGFTNDS